MIMFEIIVSIQPIDKIYCIQIKNKESSCKSQYLGESFSRYSASENSCLDYITSCPLDLDCPLNYCRTCTSSASETSMVM